MPARKPKEPVEDGLVDIEEPVQMATLVDPKRDDEDARDKTRDLIGEARSVFGEDMVTGQEPVFTGEVKRPVIAKLAKIAANLPTIAPQGRNSHFGYGFIKDIQISGALRPRMSAEGLFLTADVVEESQVEIPTKSGRSYLTKLKVLFTITDAESGDEISGHGFGYGDDAGDKGANKAFTAAEKYWLMKIFQIGGEDLEDDDRADKRASERESGQTLQQTAPVVSSSNQGEGVEKGGRQGKISKAQQSAIGSLYTQLRENKGWTAEKVIDLVGQVLDPIELAEDANAPEVLNNYIKQLSGDDAGTLITALADAKDKDEEDPSGGYPG